jgi:O-antigen/teichoic acid export membrane protein
LAEGDSEKTSYAVKYFRSTGLAWLRVGVVRGVQLIYIAIIARWLSTDQLGFVQAIALGITFVSGVLIPWVAWTMHQQALSKEDPIHAEKIIHKMFIYGVIETIILVPIFAAVYLSGIGLTIASDIGIIVLISTFQVCLFLLVQGVHLAYLRIERNVIVGAIRTVLNFLLPLILFYLTLNIVTIFWGWIIADLIILVIIIPTCGLKRQLNLYQLVRPTKALLIFALPMILIFIFNQFRSFIDQYLIILFFGYGDLAVYRNISRIPSIAQEAILTLLIPFLPIMTKVLASRPEREGLAFGITLKMIFMAVLFVGCVFIFAGLPIIELILGAQYILPESGLLLSFATLTMVFYALSSLFLRMRGAKGETFKMMIFSVLFALSIGIFLALFFAFGFFGILGTIGVAVCVTLGYALTFTVLTLQTKETALVPRGALLRLVALIPIQMLIVYVLAIILTPLDILDTLIITGISFLTLLVGSALLTIFSNEDLEILSRASKNWLNPIIKFYQIISRKQLKNGTSK